jgi:autotransporter-associated beta strand protein
MEFPSRQANETFLMQAIGHQNLKLFLSAVLLAVALPGRGQIMSDLVCAYAPSTAAAWGGEANAQVNMAAGVSMSNALNNQSGTGANFNIVGYIMSATDSSGQDNSAALGLVAGNAAFVDVQNFKASVGADQVIFVPYASTGAAGNAYQPGQWASISSTWWWGVVLAHEAGGHNFGRTHNDGMVTPKTIMLHNYCGGGAAWPYFYTDPNIWWNGTQMLSTLANDCSNGSLPNGGDNSSYSAQWMQNQVDHIAIGPALNNVLLHWSFTNAPASAPAGTTNLDLVSSAPAVVRGNGATYTGSALRIPGGTTGNVPISAMSAYIDLPNGIISSQTNITIEIWATPLSAPSWARIMDFGSCAEAGDGLGAAGEYTGASGDPAPGSTSSYTGIMLTADEGSSSTNLNYQRLEAKLTGTNFTFDAGLATTLGVQHHYAITFTDGIGTYTNQGGRWQWFRDGYSAGFVDVNFHLASVTDVNNWLGRSAFSGDSNANNDYAEVRISNVALSQRQILANYTLGPNYNPPANLVTMNGSDAWGATSTSFNATGQWGGDAVPTSGNSYQTFEFRLLTPATSSSYTFAGSSLTVGGDAAGDLEDGLYWGGTASSTITVNNLTVNNARVDNRGSGTFTLAGNLNSTNAVVVNAMNGPINLSVNLSGNGSIAYVGNQGTQNGLVTAYTGNQVTLTGNNSNFTGQTVIGYGAGAAGGLTVDSEARLGANPATFTYNQLDMNRGTLTTTTTMTLSNANRGILLDVNGGGFNVSSGTTLTLLCQLFSPTIAGPATGGNLNKSGAGTLIIGSTNSAFNGMLYVDSGNSSGSDGVVRLVNSAAMASAHSPIYIRDSGSANSSLHLSHSAGGISLPQNILVNGRGRATPAIENLVGTNTLAGGLSTYGSGSYAVQVDSGGLNIGGTSSSSDGGADTITFQGGGTVNLAGNIANGSGTLSVNKSGGGVLNFSSGSTYTGSTTVSAGTMSLAPSTAPVLHLSFENALGSGNGAIITNTGTGGVAMNGRIVSTGGASIASGGKFGNALSLNGTGSNTSNNIVIITNKVFATDASASWTVAYWLKTTTSGAVIMYQGDGTWSSSGQTTFYLNSNNTVAGTRAGCVRWAGGWLTGSTALNNNAWHFVTLVDNAGTETIYVDGTPDSVVSMMSLPLASGANQIWIGGSPDSGDGTTKMIGLIDEVYMFNRALSSAEIQSLKNNNAITNNPVNVLPVATPLTVAAGGALDLAGVSQTVAALSGNGLVTNSGSPATLTVSNNSSCVFSGIIGDTSPASTVNFISSGSGTTTLAGANAYHGTTTVNSGTLQLSSLADDAVLHLSFENTSGSGTGAVITNTGTSGAALNGLLVSTGGASIASGGRFGNALNLNGTGSNSSNNIVIINNKVLNTDAGGTWSAGYWVKTSTAGAVVMYQGDGTWSSSGQTMFYLNNNDTTSGTHAGAVRWAGGWLTGTAALNNNAWHFVMLVDNAGTETIYVDGNLDAVTSTMGLPLASDANQIWIGGAPDGGDGAAKMNGLIDEVFMFSRALSQTEVQSLYNTDHFISNPGNVLPPTTPVSVNSGATLDLGGVPQTIASLAGSGMVTNSGSALTLTISNNTGTTSFSGNISDTSLANALSLVQTGNATNIFSGANTYRGTTTVNGGELLVNGSLGPGAVIVNSGTLGGNGSIGGTVTVQSGGTLSPGAGIGILTINNPVTLEPGSTTLMAISKSPQTNDLIVVTGALNLGGTLVVTNLSGTLAAGDRFNLFQAVSTSGSFNSISLPALNSGLAWNTANLRSGSISVVATTPTNLVWNLSGFNLTLSWLAGYTGWRLQVQTNSLNVGIGTNWVDVSGASQTNNVAVPVDATQGSVFYRLVFP